eukprot:674820-Pelagomonas_calceolata.AAC.5
MEEQMPGANLPFTCFFHLQLSVDLELRHDLPINIDFAFPAIPCAALSVQILDVAGTSHSDTSAAKEMDIHKARLDKSGAGHLLRGRKNQGQYDGGLASTRKQKTLRDLPAPAFAQSKAQYTLCIKESRHMDQGSAQPFGLKKVQATCCRIAGAIGLAIHVPLLTMPQSYCVVPASAVPK